jgi:hypothetical protein
VGTLHIFFNDQVMSGTQQAFLVLFLPPSTPTIKMTITQLSKKLKGDEDEEEQITMDLTTQE